MTDRRRFLQWSAGTAAGLAGLEAAAQSRTAAPAIQRYVRLGRTGLEVSDVSFGSASSSDPALVRHALDRGVN